MVVKSGNRVAALAVGMLLSLVLTSPAAGWAWPAEGPVLRSFSAENDPYAGGQHRGIDVGGPAGANLRAPAAGVVSFTGQVPHEGLCVTIRTPDGYSITLVHVGSIGATTGTAVEEGDVVATIGPTGEAEQSEPYVHLGVRVTADPNGYVDPLSLLPARPVSQPSPRPVEQPAPPVPSAGQPMRVAPRTAQRGRSAGRAPHGTRGRAPARPQPVPATSPVRTSASEGPRAKESARVGTPRLSAPRRPPRQVPPVSNREPLAGPVAARVRTGSIERQRPAVRAVSAPAGASGARSRASRPLLLAFLGGLGVVLLGLGVAAPRRRVQVQIPPPSAGLPLRKMSAIQPGPEERLPESSTTTDLHRRRVALREWPPASGACRRLRRSVGHHRALSPSTGRPRADGQRHRRARNSRHDRGRSRGSVPA